MHLIHSKSIYLSKWAVKIDFSWFYLYKNWFKLISISSLSVAVLVIFGVKKKGTHTLVFLSDDGFTAKFSAKNEELIDLRKKK